MNAGRHLDLLFSFSVKVRVSKYEFKKNEDGTERSHINIIVVINA